MMEIRESIYLCKKEQFFFPRSKKKRVQKKCRRKYQHDVPDDQVYVIENRIIMAHPATAARLRSALSQKVDRMQSNVMMGISPFSFGYGSFMS